MMDLSLGMHYLLHRPKIFQFLRTFLLNMMVTLLTRDALAAVFLTGRLISLWDGISAKDPLKYGCLFQRLSRSGHGVWCQLWKNFPESNREDSKERVKK